MICRSLVKSRVGIAAPSLWAHSVWASAVPGRVGRMQGLPGSNVCKGAVGPLGKLWCTQHCLCCRVQSGHINIVSQGPRRASSLVLGVCSTPVRPHAQALWYRVQGLLQDMGCVSWAGGAHVELVLIIQGVVHPGGCRSLDQVHRQSYISGWSEDAAQVEPVLTHVRQGLCEWGVPYTLGRLGSDEKVLLWPSQVDRNSNVVSLDPGPGAAPAGWVALAGSGEGRALFLRVWSWPGLTVRRWTRLRFDSTLGFPGEGPASAEAPILRLKVSTANVTAWQSFLSADLPISESHVWLIQEHRLCTEREIKKARELMAARRFVSTFGKAVRTDKGGASSGTAVLRNQDIAEGQAEATKLLAVGQYAHRICWQLVQLGAVSVLMISVYGKTGDAVYTKGLVDWVCGTVQGIRFPVVIRGDWNFPPAQVQEWTLGTCGLTCIVPPHDTCYTVHGSNLYDFFVVNPMAQLLVEAVNQRETVLATHHVVTLTLRVSEGVKVTRWIRPKVAPSRKVVGPGLTKDYALVRQALEEVAPSASGATAQQDADAVWGKWVEIAGQEVAAALGQEVPEFGKKYDLQELDVLKWASAAGQKEQSLLFCLVYTRRRLSECVNMCKKEDYSQWSPRTGPKVRAMAEKWPSAGIGEAVLPLTEPWLYGQQYCQDVAHMLQEKFEKQKKQDRADAIRKWKETMAVKAAEGRKEAFQFIRKDDAVGGDQFSSLGTTQVLAKHEDFWSNLWQADGSPCTVLEEELKERPVPEFSFTPDDIREAAGSFPAGTSCPDQVPARAFAYISDEGLEALSLCFSRWVRTGVWPTSEAVVHTVLIPKATGGERPIALFRTATRVLAKLVAWRVKCWSAGQPQHVAFNAVGGRRIGDGMWRAQLRSLIADEVHHAEVMVDLAKAFEYVQRKLLARKCSDIGYPREALACALAMYRFPRRLVYRQAVTGEIHPKRGIAAGSAFATKELEIVLSTMVTAVLRKFPEAFLLVHVDDISFSASGNSCGQVADSMADMYQTVKAELEVGCRMSIAGDKTVVLGSSMQVAQAVGRAIGGAAEVTTVCKKLGAQYRLYAGNKSLLGIGKFAQQCRGKNSQRGQGPKACGKVRKDRIAKAGRRMRRVMILPKGSTKRLFRAGVVPVAVYAAEHDVWPKEDVRRLLSWTLAVEGIRPPGVPNTLAATVLPPSSDPEFRIAFAAIERWAREVWMSTQHEGTAPGPFLRHTDVLTAHELMKVHSLISSAEPGKLQQMGGPAASLVRSLEHFDLSWIAPHRLVGNDPGWGEELDLTAGSPAMLKWALADRCRCLKQKAFVTAVQARQQYLAVGCKAGHLPYAVDWEHVHKCTCHKANEVGTTRFLLGLAWGVVPTGQWLGEHGWEVEGNCESCHEPLGLAHLLEGCSQLPGSSRLERKQRLLGALRPSCFRKMQEPQVEEWSRAGLLREFINGFEKEPGTVQLRAGHKVYVDGSAKYVGTSLAAASGSVVQVVEGIEYAVGMAVPKGFPQSAVAGEMLAVNLVLILLQRGIAANAQVRDTIVVSDCQAVVNVAGRRAYASSEKFKFAGMWRHPSAPLLGNFQKIRAHQSQAQAAEQGSLADWGGNNRADEVAKFVLPKWSGDPDGYLAAMKQGRGTLRQIASEVGKGLWEAFRSAKARGSAQVTAIKAVKRGHVVIFSQGQWMCVACGSNLRSGPLAAARKRCPGRSRVAACSHQSHSLHSGRFGGPGGTDKLIVFCSKCGCYGTTRACGLVRTCPGQAAGRKAQLRRLSDGKHPVSKCPIVGVAALHGRTKGARGAAVGSATYGMPDLGYGMDLASAELPEDSVPGPVSVCSEPRAQLPYSPLRLDPWGFGDPGGDSSTWYSQDQDGGSGTPSGAFEEPPGASGQRLASACTGQRAQLPQPHLGSGEPGNVLAGVPSQEAMDAQENAEGPQSSPASSTLRSGVGSAVGAAA